MESGFIVEADDDSWLRRAGSGALAVTSEPVALSAGVSILREEWMASYGGPFEKTCVRGAEPARRNGSARLDVSGWWEADVDLS